MKRFRLWLRRVVLRWLGYGPPVWEFVPGDGAFVTTIHLAGLKAFPGHRLVVFERRNVPEVKRGTIRVVLEMPR